MAAASTDRPSCHFTPYIMHSITSIHFRSESIALIPIILIVCIYLKVRFAIYGNIMVWQDNRNGNYDIYGLDLITNEEFQITTDPKDQLYPAIYGDIMIWLDERNDPDDFLRYLSDLFAYGLSTKEKAFLLRQLSF